MRKEIIMKTIITINPTIRTELPQAMFVSEEDGVVRITVDSGYIIPGTNKTVSEVLTKNAQGKTVELIVTESVGADLPQGAFCTVGEKEITIRVENTFKPAGATQTVGEMVAALRRTIEIEKLPEGTFHCQPSEKLISSNTIKRLTDDEEETLRDIAYVVVSRDPSLVFPEQRVKDMLCELYNVDDIRYKDEAAEEAAYELCMEFMREAQIENGAPSVMFALSSSSNDADIMERMDLE